MTASTNTRHGHAWPSRLLVALTIGLMMLALGATTVFAGTGTPSTNVAGNAAPVVSTGGDGTPLNEDDDEDEDEDGEDDEGDGGGLPATDTAPLVNGVGVLTGGEISLNEDDDDDEDEDEDEEGGGGGLPATDTASIAQSGGGTPVTVIALLVIAGLAGGAVTVAGKRTVRS